MQEIKPNKIYKINLSHAPENEYHNLKCRAIAIWRTGSITSITVQLLDGSEEELVVSDKYLTPVYQWEDL